MTALNTQENKNKILSTSEAAKMLGVSPTSMRRYEERGLITAARRANGYRVFLASDIEKLKNDIEKNISTASQEFILGFQKEIEEKKSAVKVLDNKHVENYVSTPTESLNATPSDIKEEFIPAPVIEEIKEIPSVHRENKLDVAESTFQTKISNETPTKFNLGLTEETNNPYVNIQEERIESISDTPNLASYLKAKVHETMSKHTEIPLDDSLCRDSKR